LLLDFNKNWATKTRAQNCNVFTTAQAPPILWFGCSDSRVPETTILELFPGEVFVHRNIANLLPPTDASSLSVIQFAVEGLKVGHIIVCGHYNCGGVNSVFKETPLGHLGSWLASIRELYQKHKEYLEKLELPEAKRLLSELNVRQQVQSLLGNVIVQNAIKEKKMQVHGWVYDVADGVCTDLKVPQMFDDCTTE
ncbi:carbonic anhydrase, partial [Trichophaea hybrida]